MWTVNFQISKLDLEKTEEPEIKFPTSTGSSKKQESSRKTSISALLTMPKPLIVWLTTNCGKFFKRWEYQPTWPASWEICMQVNREQWKLSISIIACPKKCLCMCAKSLQSCPTLCDPMDYSLPGFSVHWILHTRILEWVAMSSSMGSSQPRGQTHISCNSWIAGRFFAVWATEKAQKMPIT